MEPIALGNTPHTCGRRGETITMNYIRTLFAIMGALVASGTTSSAEDDFARRATLYTPPLAGDTFVCKAVNVSKRPLHIGFAIFGDDGSPLSCTDCPPNPAPAVPVRPGTEAELALSLASGEDGYCKVDLLGTADRNDVRVVLEVQRTRTFGPTNIPVFVFKSIEGH
jgi:hypothetical protein